MTSCHNSPWFVHLGRFPAIERRQNVSEAYWRYLRDRISFKKMEISQLTSGTMNIDKIENQRRFKIPEHY